MNGAGGDIELDGTKLEPDEADERWLRAGRIVRENRPDVYRRTFALVEAQAALNEPGEDPDARARVALSGSGVAPPPSPERDRIRAAVVKVLGAVAREPVDALRHTAIDSMLRAVDWSLVPVDLVAAMLCLVTDAAPLAALQQAHPHAAAPIPIGPGIGLEMMADELARLADLEVSGSVELDVPPTKGEN